MCDETSTGFTTNGDDWSVTLSIANCVAQGLTEYYVVITATDSVDAISSTDITVQTHILLTTQALKTLMTRLKKSGLPSIGMFASIVAMLGAALLARRD